MFFKSKQTYCIVIALNEKDDNISSSVIVQSFIQNMDDAFDDSNYCTISIFITNFSSSWVIPENEKLLFQYIYKTISYFFVSCEGNTKAS